MKFVALSIYFFEIVNAKRVSFVIVTMSLMVTTIILFHFSGLLPHLSFSF